MDSTTARLRIGQAARYTGHRIRAIRLAVEKGELNAERPTGGNYYFSTDELDRWLEAIKTTKR